MLIPGMQVKLRNAPEVAPMWRGKTLEFVEYDPQNEKRGIFIVVTAPPMGEIKIGKKERLRLVLVEIPDPKNNEQALALLEKED